MQTWPLLCVVLVGCSQPAPKPRSEPRPEPAPEVDMQPGDPPRGPWRYRSDCTLTNPIARNPCVGNPVSSRGLSPCTLLGVAPEQGCRPGAPSCYVERRCPDGRTVIADFLVCAKQVPARCFTISSRRFKQDVRYLAADELRDLARQVEALPLARYRYNGQTGPERLGFLVEDAPGAPFIEDGSAVDLYALLTASIAAIQTQDERIRVLEARLQQCPAR